VLDVNRGNRRTYINSSDSKQQVKNKQTKNKTQKSNKLNQTRSILIQASIAVMHSCVTDSDENKTSYRS